MAAQHLAFALLLIVLTVGIHGAGTLVIFGAVFRSRMFAMRHFGHINNASLLTSVVVALLAIHLAEVVLWAASYFYLGCFPNFDTSMYFSIGTYTTVGYGDVVILDQGWRLLGGVEALIGSLMLCWSTGILVHVVTKVYRQHIEVWEREEEVARGRMNRPDHRYRL
jgi:voltage-gated potassium channel